MSARRTGRFAGLCAAALVVSLVSACTTASHEQPAAPPASEPTIHSLTPRYTGKPVLTPDMTDDGPGSLVEFTPYSGGSELLEDDGATYMRVVYRSTSGVDGTPTEVSAALAIPPGEPPEGGWPVVGFGQGTKGVLYQCASSLFASLPKQDWSMSQFIRAGYAVAVSDYQGSGVRGYAHPFLDAHTYGYNIIDSVRAMRRVGGDLISNKWISYGHSAGGLAVWAATELAPEYGQDLNLLGSIAMAPAVGMPGLADVAWNEQLTFEQRPTMVYALQSLSWFKPELDLEEFRSGVVKDNWDMILDCGPADLEKLIPIWANVLRTMSNQDLKPRTPEDVEWLRNALAERATLNTRRIDTPLVVVYGTADKLVNNSWFETDIRRACEMGSNLEIIREPGKAHGDIDQAFVMGWFTDRLEGVPAPPSNCDDWLKLVSPK